MKLAVSSPALLLLTGALACGLVACSDKNADGSSGSGGSSGSSGSGSGDSAKCDVAAVKSCTRVRRSGDKPLCVDIFGDDPLADITMQSYCGHEPESIIADGPCEKAEVVGGCEYKTSLSCHRVWYYPSAQLTTVEEACAEGNGTYVAPPR